MKGVPHFEVKIVFFSRDLLGEGKAQEVTGVALAHDYNGPAWCAVPCRLLQPGNLLPSPFEYFLSLHPDSSLLILT